MIAASVQPGFSRPRGWRSVLTTTLAAAAVAFAGLIGFIGLMVPHIMRILVGPDHRRLLPAAALFGALLLLAADTVARTVIAPAEIPVGIITALVGVCPLYSILGMSTCPAKRA